MTTVTSLTRPGALRVLIREHLTRLIPTSDYGIEVMRPMAWTLAALTKSINGHSRFRKRNVSRAAVLDALNSMRDVRTRTHRPSGETLYKLMTDSDRQWAHLNGGNGWASMSYPRRSTPVAVALTGAGR